MTKQNNNIDFNSSMFFMQYCTNIFNLYANVENVNNCINIFYKYDEEFQNKFLEFWRKQSDNFNLNNFHYALDELKENLNLVQKNIEKLEYDYCKPYFD